MRPVREITAEEEQFRVEPTMGYGVVRRDPVEPEPVGTVVLMAFRVEGYDADCDGSLMARLRALDADGNETGWAPKRIGIGNETALVVTPEELKGLFGGRVITLADAKAGPLGGANKEHDA